MFDTCHTTCLNNSPCPPRGVKKKHAISLIQQVVFPCRTDLGVSLYTPRLAIVSSPHERLEPVHPVHDDLDGLLGLVFEQLDQRPRVALHAMASDEDGHALEGFGEHISLAATANRCRPLRAEDRGRRCAWPKTKATHSRVKGCRRSCTSMCAYAAARFAMRLSGLADDSVRTRRDVELASPDFCIVMVDDVVSCDVVLPGLTPHGGNS